MEQTKNDRTIVLTRHTYYQIVHDLWRALPPPVSDHPDDLVCRDNAAIAEVAALLPADPAEAALACQFVAACAQAMDCLRLVNEHRTDLAVAMKCRAQAASMMRQACMSQSTLLRSQDARRKRAALGDTSTNEPAWSDHGIVDRMAEALRRAPAHAPEAGSEGAAIPETTEQGIVSENETNSQIHANETPTRCDAAAAQIDETPASLPRPHTSWPSHDLDERPEAPSGRVSAGFAPSNRDLSASDAVTDAMNRTPRPTETRPRAEAA